MAIHVVKEHALQKWALEAGIISKSEHVRKLTIVMEVGQATKVTVDRYAEGEGVLSVPAPDMKAVDVTVTE